MKKGIGFGSTSYTPTLFSWDNFYRHPVKGNQNFIVSYNCLVSILFGSETENNLSVLHFDYKLFHFTKKTLLR